VIQKQPGDIVRPDDDWWARKDEVGGPEWALVVAVDGCIRQDPDTGERRYPWLIVVYQTGQVAEIVDDTTLLVFHR